MLGDRIKRIRESKAMGLNETAKLAHISGSYLSSIENGFRKNPSVNALSNISAALGVPVDEFFKDDPVSDEQLTNIDSVDSENLRNNTAAEYKPSLLVKEQDKLGAKAESMVANFRMSLSQNKNYLDEDDYGVIEATVMTLIEQMTLKNKKNLQLKE